MFLTSKFQSANPHSLIAGPARGVNAKSGPPTSPAPLVKCLRFAKKDFPQPALTWEGDVVSIFA